MIMLVLRLYWEFVKLLFLALCLAALYIIVAASTLIPVFIMIAFTDWSAVTMAIAIFPLYCLYYILIKLFAESAYMKARCYLTEQIDKRKPNPETHCPNCGYDLRGLRHIRCPECGKFNPKFNPRKFLDQNQTRKKQNKKLKQRKPR